MRKNIAIGGLTIMVLVLGAKSMHLHRKVNALAIAAECVAQGEEGRSDAAQPPSGDGSGATVSADRSTSGRPVPALAQDERATYERQIAKLQARLTSVSAEQEHALEQKETESEEEPDKKSPMSGLADMLKAPGMKDVIRAQQKATMDMTYGSLYEYLDLPEDRMAQFKDLLLERQMALMDAGLAMMDNSLSAEEKKAAGAASKVVKEEFDERIREFLSEDDADVYEQFEATQPERMQIHFFKQALAGTEPLTSDQEHALITGMHEERKGFTFETDFEDPANMDRTAFDEEKIKTHMAELAVLQERYTTRAAEVLTEAQLKQFKTSQEQQRAMQEMGLKMAGQMFGE